jgi:PAS domain-containing protein
MALLLPPYVLLGGLSLMLLGVVVAWSLATTRSRALVMARAMSDERRRGEEWTRALVDSMLEGLIVVDARSRIESVNPAAATIFGYAPEDLVGRTIVIVANLKPAKIRGIESRGMLLAAKRGNALRLITVDGELPSGCEVG